MNFLGFPTFGTNPGLRVPMQGSEPGLRMPSFSESAPLKTQFGAPNMDLLGMGMNMLAASQPKQQDIPQLGLLMPKNRDDFKSLYANYLRQMGLLA